MAVGLTDNWGELLVSANIYGVAMAILTSVKGSVTSSGQARRGLGGV